MVECLDRPCQLRPRHEIQGRGANLSATGCLALVGAVIHHAILDAQGGRAFLSEAEKHDALSFLSTERLNDFIFTCGCDSVLSAGYIRRKALQIIASKSRLPLDQQMRRDQNLQHVLHGEGVQEEAES